MSFGKRLSRLVRSNLNALFERDEFETPRRPGASIENMSDAELEEELARRKARREAAAAAASEASSRTSSRYRSSRSRRATAAGDQARLARLYKQLECEPGADLSEVRKAYREMMRRYHPDMHAQDPDKQRLATELSQRLTLAFNELSDLLRKS